MSDIKCMECPWQSILNVDCGPFFIFFLLRRIHDLPVKPAIFDGEKTKFQRHAFRQWLRSQLTRYLSGRMHGEDPCLFDMLGNLPGEQTLLGMVTDDAAVKIDQVQDTISAKHYVSKKQTDPRGIARGKDVVKTAAASTNVYPRA
jgi:hypothetical protein